MVQFHGDCGTFAEYGRDLANGGQHRKANGFTLTPSLFITPQVELVGMDSRFDTDGDEAIRLNQASPNLPTSYPDNRRFDHIDQFYFGINHYLNGDDLKAVFPTEPSCFAHRTLLIAGRAWSSARST